LLDRINELIINPIIILLMSVALVVFIWGVVQFVMNREGTTISGDGKSSPGSLEQGKRHMVWGIIGLVIMVSVFGIIKVIIRFLDSLT